MKNLLSQLNKLIKVNQELLREAEAEAEAKREELVTNQGWADFVVNVTDFLASMSEYIMSTCIVFGILTYGYYCLPMLLFMYEKLRVHLGLNVAYGLGFKHRESEVIVYNKKYESVCQGIYFYSMLVWVISIPVYRVILDYYEVNVMKMIRSLGFGDMIDKLLGNLVDKLVDKSVDKLELESTLRVINDLDTYGVLSSNMFEMLISSGVLFFMINAFSRLCVRLLYVLLYIRYNFVNIGNCSVFTIHFFGLYCINFVKLCILSILLLSMLFVFANTLYEEVILLLGMFLYGFYRYFVQVAFSMWLFNDFWKFTKNTSFMTLLFYVDTELDQLSVRFARKYLMGINKVMELMLIVLCLRILLS